PHGAGPGRPDVRELPAVLPESARPPHAAVEHDGLTAKTDETRDGAVYNTARAPVAQWREQPPPKGQVGRSIRLRGASFRRKKSEGEREKDFPLPFIPASRRPVSPPSTTSRFRISRSVPDPAACRPPDRRPA